MPFGMERKEIVDIATKVMEEVREGLYDENHLSRSEEKQIALAISSAIFENNLEIIAALRKAGINM